MHAIDSPHKITPIGVLFIKNFRVRKFFSCKNPKNFGTTQYFKLNQLFSYTLFIVLYPMGASGEIITMIAGLPEIAAKKHFTLEMPNALNFGFSFYVFIVIMCLIYIPG